MGHLPPAPERSVLRFLTCGSVDDGKSTLIGRLLLDTKSLLADTLAKLERNAHRRGLGALDLALLTDGLIAEREQGITIDVAYRYFATSRRTFIIADSPGHVQYTRNMFTAASTADAAVLLVDARKGLVEQTRRHATIACLLGVRHLVVAVNKMDQVGYAAERFAHIAQDLAGWLQGQSARAAEVHYLPLSALVGANVVERDARLAWFQGPTLVELLEGLPARQAEADAPLRLPIQWVCRPEQSEFRGYAGRIESGCLAVGDAVAVFPSGVRARVRGLIMGTRERRRAGMGESVMVTLDDAIDVARGDLLTGVADGLPAATRDFAATVCWLSAAALEPRREYLLQQGTRTTRARIAGVAARLNIDAPLWRPTAADAAQTVQANDIVRLRLGTQTPIAADPYPRFRGTGSFILIDPSSNDTVAAGMMGAD